MLTRFTTIPSLKELHSRYECENQICGRNYLDYRLWHIATEYSSPAIIQHWESTLSEQTRESEPETDNTVDIGMYFI